MTPLIGRASESGHRVWKRRLLWTLAIIGGLLLSLWLTSTIVELSIYGAYNHYIDSLSDHLRISTYLANVLSLLFLVPFFLGVKYYLFSLRDRKRKQRIGLAMLLGMGVVYNLALYIGTKNEHFDAKGHAVKFYALVPGGVVFSDRAGTEPKYGVPFRPVSPDNIKWLLRIQQGRIQAVNDPVSHDWFDGVTGDPVLWYCADSGGNLYFFDGPGYAPATRAELKPVTPEIRQAWERGHPTASAQTTPQTASSRTPIELDQRHRRLAEFQSVVNSRVNLVPGKRNVAIILVAANTGGNFSPQQAFYGYLRSENAHVITDLFRHDFLTRGYFDDMYTGDPELLKIATTTARVDALILGRLSYSFRKGSAQDNELISCDMALSYKVVDQSGNVVKSDSFPAIGPGFSESAALERAVELLANQFSERVLKTL